MNESYLPTTKTASEGEIEEITRWLDSTHSNPATEKEEWNEKQNE